MWLDLTAVHTAVRNGNGLDWIGGGLWCRGWSRARTKRGQRSARRAAQPLIVPTSHSTKRLSGRILDFVRIVVATVHPPLFSYSTIAVPTLGHLLPRPSNFHSGVDHCETPSSRLASTLVWTIVELLPVFPPAVVGLDLGVILKSRERDRERDSLRLGPPIRFQRLAGWVDVEFARVGVHRTNSVRPSASTRRRHRLS